MSQSNYSALSDPELLTIFTYAPAGLGHLRVTDALADSLPVKTNSLILGAADEKITVLHRITSIHPLLRRMMEWVQCGEPEDVFTRLYRWWLGHTSQKLYEQLLTLVGQRLEQPRKLLIIATHFGLAHQLAVIKNRLLAEEGIEVKLVMQVTDDSPQHIWFVPNADLIVVPSEKTKQELQRYQRQSGLRPSAIVVAPYPLSPALSEQLTQEEFGRRQLQLNPDAQGEIKFAIPISGAAVGLEYFSKLTNQLSMLSSRYRFIAVGRYSPHTRQFLKQLAFREGSQVYTSSRDREVVDSYEQLYQNQVIALEITKPSEQAFKALLKPKDRGGSILLFAEPVGRQEYDNLNFLTRNGLIPTTEENQQLWDMAGADVSLKETEWLRRSHHWRGLLLPQGSTATANFIDWALNQGLLAAMVEFEPGAQANSAVVSSDGTKQFWEQVARFL